MSEEMQNIIEQLVEMYNIMAATDIQDALKNLFDGTIQSMLEANLEGQMEGLEEDDPYFLSDLCFDLQNRLWR